MLLVRNYTYPVVAFQLQSTNCQVTSPDVTETVERNKINVTTFCACEPNRQQSCLYTGKFATNFQLFEVCMHIAWCFFLIIVKVFSVDDGWSSVPYVTIHLDVFSLYTFFNEETYQSLKNKVTSCLSNHIQGHVHDYCNILLFKELHTRSNISYWMTNKTLQCHSLYLVFCANMKCRCFFQLQFLKTFHLRKSLQKNNNKELHQNNTVGTRLVIFYKI